MLQILVPKGESFDELTQQFVYSESRTLQLEHSLVSLSKWESKWLKPFLSKNEKTEEEIIDYVRCMTLTQNVPDETYYFLNKDNIIKIKEYINAPMTATTLPKSDKISREIITAEIIYYWMVAYQIPVEFQKWHLNRLLTLINVCSIKNDTKKTKVPLRDQLAQRNAINEARKAKLNTTG